MQIFGKLMMKHSIWNKVPMAPADPILGISVAFQKCENKDKVNLGVGAYRDDNGKPYILECVKKATAMIHEKGMDHEYLPIGGLQSFSENAVKLQYGSDFQGFKENKVAHMQCLSGTGGVRMAFDFAAKFLGKDLTIHIPDPSWPSHKNICVQTGVKHKLYRYYDNKAKALDFEGLINDLSNNTKPGDMVLLHTCAHNPTGCDPSFEQWKQMRDVFETKGLIAFFDNAYQGFTSGNLEEDAQAVRYFSQKHDAIPIISAQSFAKNFGLYGERIGAFSVVCSSQEEQEKVNSQLRILARISYSNPPLQGARIVDIILKDQELYGIWLKEIQVMANRIKDMRWALRNSLEQEGSKLDWKHITNQKGMFAFTGMSEQQVLKIRSDHHIYMTNDGRISIAGLNTKNVQYIAKSIHAVTK